MTRTKKKCDFSYHRIVRVLDGGPDNDDNLFVQTVRISGTTDQKRALAAATDFMNDELGEMLIACDVYVGPVHECDQARAEAIWNLETGDVFDVPGIDERYLTPAEHEWLASGTPEVTAPQSLVPEHQLALRDEVLS